MKGYKAYKKGLICKNKKYKENKVFEEDEANICKNGIHFCVNPLDCLDYYPLVDSDGELTEFTNVENLAEEKTNDNKKYCTTRLKIGTKLGLSGFIFASINFLLETYKIEKNIISGDYSQLVANGDGSQLAASGNDLQLATNEDGSQLAASGNDSKLVASGDYSQLATSGNGSQLATSGDYSKLVASGDYSKLVASGYGSKLAASGNYSKLVADRYGSKLVAGGYNSQLAASGDYSQLATSGNGSQLATSGDYSKLVASGYGSKLVASGYGSKLAASGNYSQLHIQGENGVGVATGQNSIIKGVIGTWITLAEYDCDGKCICVKSVRIDGKKIKANTWYKLKKGEFCIENKNNCN